MAKIIFIRKGNRRIQIVYVNDNDGDIALSIREYNRAKTIAKTIKKKM